MASLPFNNTTYFMSIDCNVDGFMCVTRVIELTLHAVEMLWNQSVIVSF